MNNTLNTSSIFGWIFAMIFIVIGVLNLFIVHPVPGLFYIILSLIYLPPTYEFLRRKLGYSIPFVVKLILFIVIMWATLAVGDLMEMFESWLCDCESLP